MTRANPHFNLPFLSLLFTVLSLCFYIDGKAQVDTAGISLKVDRSNEKGFKQSVTVVYSNGKVIYKKEKGEFNMKSQQPVGAISQWFTTALVMLFVQEGTLSLNDKVSDYLPIFAKHGKSYITIGHCLTHNTGIKSEQGVGKMFQKNKYNSLEAEVNDYAAKREIETNPGTQFYYSNMGFNIAARVLEVVSKKPFDRLTQEKLFRPLAMRNTTFANENYNDGINAATGARSTPGDLVNFMSMLLNKGNFNNKPFVKSETIAAMRTLSATAATIKNAPEYMRGNDYALGQWIAETDANGNASAIVTPSFIGSWALVDFCRQSAVLLFVKESSGEFKKEFGEVVAIVNEGIQPTCQ